MIKFAVLCHHYTSLDCSMESAAILEDICHYRLMKDWLSNQVIIAANTKQGFLSRKQESWEVVTLLAPIEILEKRAVY